MRILHTADNHLEPGNPQRMLGLKAAVDLAVGKGADLLIVAGDLFDKPGHVRSLSREVGEVLEPFGGEILVIPGNHDSAGFKDHALPSRVRVAAGEPLFLDLEGTRIIGVPYDRERPPEKILSSLSHEETEGSVLVVHASLLGRFYHPQEEEEDCEGIRPGTIERLGPAYLALGHWHAPSPSPLIFGGVPAAYPGSTSPITRAELGPRMASVIEVEESGIDHESCRLEGVRFRETARIDLTEDLMKEEIDGAVRRIEEARSDKDPYCDLDLEIIGYAPSPDHRRMIEERTGIETGITAVSNLLENRTASSLFRSILSARPGEEEFAGLDERFPAVRDGISDEEANSKALSLLVSALGGVLGR